MGFAELLRREELNQQLLILVIFEKAISKKSVGVRGRLVS